MPTERAVVFFHAHPDDEAIFTGGTMALLAAAGWRVVLVLATAGEQGVTSTLVGPDVPLAVRRMGETARAADELGARRVEFLGYHDSGLGRAEAGPGAFAAAPLDEAAARKRSETSSGEATSAATASAATPSASQAATTAPAASASLR